MSDAGIIASLALGAYKLHDGRQTQKKGKDLEGSLSRPVYQIPGEVYQNNALAERMAKEGISAQEKNEFIDNTATNAANTVRRFKTRKAGLLGAEIAGDQVAKANRELRMSDTRQKLANIKDLILSNNAIAQYKDKQFQLNEIDKYGEDLNYARSLQAAGKMSINNGIDSLVYSANSFSEGTKEAAMALAKGGM